MREKINLKFENCKYITMPADEAGVFLQPTKSAKTMLKINIISLQKNPAACLDAFSEEECVKIMRYFDRKYHDDGDSPISDAVYDAMRDFVFTKWPNNPYNKKVGYLPSSSVGRKTKATLPFCMPSLDKVKPESDAIRVFLDKHKGVSFVVSNKIDGISLEIVYSGENVSIYTRGDGSIGQDVSHLANVLDIPKAADVAKYGRVVVRVEAAISKRDFEMFDRKNGGDFATDRNMISGIFNRIDSKHPALQHIKVLAHRVYAPTNMLPVKQFEFLLKIGFSVPRYTVISDLTEGRLLSLLESRKQKSEYSMDGLVVSANVVENASATNPKHTVAFKANVEEAVYKVKVVRVVWETSRTGKIKPRVQIPPTNVKGVRVEFLTGFNAFFIKHGYPYKGSRLSNKESKAIGPGAIIKFVRSGDVIPHIIEVVVGAAKPQMPSIEYEWGKNGVEIYAAYDTKSEHLKKMVHFFKCIGTEFLSEGLMRKLIDAGYTTIFRLLRASVEQLSHVEGFSTVLATKIYNNIHESLKTAPLTKLGDGSGLFGENIGERKLGLLFREIPNVLVAHNDKNLYAKIANIHGFSDKTAQVIIKSIPDFVAFLQRLEKPLVEKPTQRLSTLKDIVAVFTQVRDKELEKQIIDLGGNVTNNVSKNTTHVISIENPKETDKIEKARELGIPILSVAKFKRQFL